MLNAEIDPYFSKTLEKGLFVLSLFDRDHPQRSLTELCQLTGINKTSVYRFVNTLVQMGYLRKSKSNKLLRLGPKAFVLGYSFFHGFDVLQSVKPLIEKVFIEHKISLDSALLHEHTLISLYRLEVPNLIYFRLPLIMENLYARALGKAVLANLDHTDLIRFLGAVERKKLTPNTMVEEEVLMRDLEITRNRGYSINNEEYVKGLICIGAPVTNFNTGLVAGAVSLDFPTSEYSLDTIERNYTGILTKLASDVSAVITSADL
jgi:DNA-binding IclR family transcriptional regulator